MAWRGREGALVVEIAAVSGEKVLVRYSRYGNVLADLGYVEKLLPDSVCNGGESGSVQKYTNDGQGVSLSSIGRRACPRMHEVYLRFETPSVQ